MSLSRLLTRRRSGARLLHLGAVFLILFVAARAPGQDSPGIERFQKEIRPILREYCWDCHADGGDKGGISFDSFESDAAMLEHHELWLKALKNVRAGIMPPPKKTQPDPAQKRQLEQWIKTAVFKTDSLNPDPGRVTVRRLNRVEYRNTIRDLMGVDFDTDKEFPPDDAGHGFDNIGDVLTLPPMLLEKYLAAARTIVTRSVPAVAEVPAEQVLVGRSFSGAGTNPPDRANRGPMSANSMPATALPLSYYEAAAASNTFKAQHAGRYQLLLNFTANERYVDNQFDYNKCRLVFKADGKELLSKEYGREGGKAFHYEFDQDWNAGDHELRLEVLPLTPEQKQVRALTLRLDSVTVRGPMEPKYWVRPKNYERFFRREAP
ncbi:MAG: DUF1587 domain-containing protein, partial [Verrucomicrobiales bacterium]|nr:DUF1587 domain-containing protein [Verrucomicrobiales bacterium]